MWQPGKIGENRRKGRLYPSLAVSGNVPVYEGHTNRKLRKKFPFLRAFGHTGCYHRALLFVVCLVDLEIP
jgi:hypothetical protein